MINNQINFVSMRKPAMILSLLLLTISIGSIIVKGLNLGLDFNGGTLVEVEFDTAKDLSEIRAVLNQQGFKDVIVQQFGSPKDILIRVEPDATQSSEAVGDKIMSSLTAIFPDVSLRRVEFVGPKVGEELTEQGGLAMVVALIGILIYVGFRFEYRFALGSVTALLHDVIITIGIFSLFQFDFDLSVLAAVLAVIGYSLNDTIVVYDRIRENFRKIRKGSSEDIVNTSLNQTLSRTLVTSLTTLMVLGALYFLGGELIRWFALTLIIGVLVGTYSSIYVASSVILALGISKQDLMLPVKEGDDLEEMPFQD